MAYNVATLIQKDAPMSDGRLRIVIRFTGNAGEPQRDREHYLDGATTALSLRQWCIAEADRMGSGKTIATAKAVWEGKASRLQRAKDLGLTAAQAVTDQAALDTDVNATYVAGYI